MSSPLTDDKPQASGNPRAEEAFAFFAALPPERRSYAAVAEQFAVNLTTVKRWAAAGGWRRRVQDRELAIARKAADEVDSTAVSGRARQIKLLELALVKLVNAIAEGSVRGSYGDLDRLLRLEGILKGTDKSLPLEEVNRIFEQFLRAIEREIHEPEQRRRIAQAVRDAIDAAEASR